MEKLPHATIALRIRLLKISIFSSSPLLNLFLKAIGVIIFAARVYDSLLRSTGIPRDEDWEINFNSRATSSSLIK